LESFTSTLSWKGQKSARCGEVTITSTWHIKSFSNLWHCREEISKNYRIKVQNLKGQNFRDTPEERVAKRRNSKLRFLKGT